MCTQCTGVQWNIFDSHQIISALTTFQTFPGVLNLLQWDLAHNSYSVLWGLLTINHHRDRFIFIKKSGNSDIQWLHVSALKAKLIKSIKKKKLYYLNAAIQFVFIKAYYVTSSCTLSHKIGVLLDRAELNANNDNNILMYRRYNVYYHKLTY